jgi:UDP-N-acetylmuramyl tripeptide synthase
MGRIAAKLSDLVVITSDNPRSEDPLEIIRQVETGVRTEKMKPIKSDIPKITLKRGYLVEPDRRKAIYAAIRASRVEDVVLIAGKGHETYQIIGKEKFPFDDRKVAMEALETETVFPKAGAGKKKTKKPAVW